MTFDPRLGKLIHKRSRKPVTAVVPVHLYGQTADMDPDPGTCRAIQSVSDRGCLPGARGASIFRVSTANGEASAPWALRRLLAFTQARIWAPAVKPERLQQTTSPLRRKSECSGITDRSRKYYHDMEGYNGRLDAIQAGILLTKLRFLSDWNTERRKRASTYRELLAAASDQVILPHQPTWANGVYHLYVIRTEERDQMREYLSTFNVRHRDPLSCTSPPSEGLQ